MIEEAGKMYEELLLKGLEPNVFTYNALIRGYSMSGNPDRAYAVYEKMMAGGCSPNTGTFAQLPSTQGTSGLIALDHFGCDSVGLVMFAMLVVRLLLPCFKRFQGLWSEIFESEDEEGEE
ncbi:unnamed protein product [Camellia sinensis]